MSVQQSKNTRKRMTYMKGRTRVRLAKKLWTESKNKQELKQRISAYMSKNYPHYRVVEVGKYYALCEVIE